MRQRAWILRKRDGREDPYWRYQGRVKSYVWKRGIDEEKIKAKNHAEVRQTTLRVKDNG